MNGPQDDWKLIKSIVKQAYRVEIMEDTPRTDGKCWCKCRCGRKFLAEELRVKKGLTQVCGGPQHYRRRYSRSRYD